MDAIIFFSSSDASERFERFRLYRLHSETKKICERLLIEFCIKSIFIYKKYFYVYKKVLRFILAISLKEKIMAVLKLEMLIYITVLSKSTSGLEKKRIRKNL